jgi:hypothetical protein
VGHHPPGLDIPDLTILWRPVGALELELIKAADMRAFPPRLPEQPIFYPVLTQEYATKIARDWNASRGGGYVLRFKVRNDFIDAYEIHDVGGQAHREYWIPADDLEAFNAAIMGEIEIVAEFKQD